MNRTKTTLYICMIGSAALTLAGVILRTVFMLTAYDADIGYFQVGTAPVVSQLLSILAVLFPAVTCITIPKNQLSTAWDEKVIAFTAPLPAAALVVFGIYRLITCSLYQETSVLFYAQGLLALLGAAYLALSPVPKINQRSPLLRAVLGMCVIFWALTSVADTYFDLFTTMNSPIKVILQFGFLSIALLMIAELRFGLGKAAPRMAVCAHCLALYFGLTGGISTLVASLRYSTVTTDHTIYAIVLTTVGIYAAVRLTAYALSNARGKEASV